MREQFLSKWGQLLGDNIMSFIPHLLSLCDVLFVLWSCKEMPGRGHENEDQVFL